MKPPNDPYPVKPFEVSEGILKIVAWQKLYDALVVAGVLGLMGGVKFYPK